jgi:hypothetical protein
MGGALGVAVIGSLFASLYRPGIEREFRAAGVPNDAIAGAKDSLAGALAAANRLPGSVAARLSDLAKTEFVDALGGSLLVAAVVLLVAAVIVFVFLPARAPHAVADHDGAIEGLASLTFAEAEGKLVAEGPALLHRAPDHRVEGANVLTGDGDAGYELPARRRTG